VTVEQEDVQMVVEKANESKKREREHDESVKNKERKSPEEKRRKYLKMHKKDWKKTSKPYLKFFMA